MVLHKLCTVQLHSRFFGMKGNGLHIKGMSEYQLVLNYCKLNCFKELNYYIWDIVKDIDHFPTHIHSNIYSISSLIHQFVLNTRCKELGNRHIDLMNLNTFGMMGRYSQEACRPKCHLSQLLNLQCILCRLVIDLLSCMSIIGNLLAFMSKVYIDHSISYYKFGLDKILSIDLGQVQLALAHIKMFRSDMWYIHCLSPYLYIIYKNYHILHKSLQLFEYSQ